MKTNIIGTTQFSHVILLVKINLEVVSTSALASNCVGEDKIDALLEVLLLSFHLDHALTYGINKNGNLINE